MDGIETNNSSYTISPTPFFHRGALIVFRILITVEVERAGTIVRLSQGHRPLYLSLDLHVMRDLIIAPPSHMHFATALDLNASY